MNFSLFYVINFTLFNFGHITVIGEKNGDGENLLNKLNNFNKTNIRIERPRIFVNKNKFESVKIDFRSKNKNLISEGNNMKSYNESNILLDILDKDEDKYLIIEPEGFLQNFKENDEQRYKNTKSRKTQNKKPEIKPKTEGNIIKNIRRNGMKLKDNFHLRKSNKHKNKPEMESKSRQRRAVMARKDRIWDYGVIPYEIDNIFNGHQKATFKQAMKHWENYTCIKFVERDAKYHSNYIFFTIKNCGCCSFVGKRGNGRQAISIGSNCDKFGIVVHELGHVIGFWHEHTRTDRDQYIEINNENILRGQEYNFNVLDQEDINSLGLPYDYNSIMHYARNTFSKSMYLDTITPIISKGEQLLQDIGQRIHLSEGDIAQANLLYQCPKCGQTFQQSKGTIISPGYILNANEQLTNYSHYTNTNEKFQVCEWRVTATNGENIILKIRELQISTNDTTGSCKDNYLEIRDGYWLKSPLLAKICGNKINGKMISGIQSNSSRMLLTYVSNIRVEQQLQGFVADFESTCGGTLFINNNRRIDSPNYPLDYQPNKECIWRIKVPDEHQVALKFQTFEIENHDNCIYDYVEIRDGYAANSELIGRFCGQKLPPTIRSSSNQMYVKFVSDSTVENVGFSGLLMMEADECKFGNHGCQHECINTLGSYKCICDAGYELESDGKSCSDACGGKINATIGNKLNLTSPSYPDVYPILKKCIWEITTLENYNVFLNFTYFDLEGSKHHEFKECSFDYVKIYSKLKDNRLKRIDTFCGSDLPPLIQSEQNSLRFEFHSDKSVQHTGFVVEILTDFNECSRNNGECQHYCIKTYKSYSCSCHSGYSLHENGRNCTETSCKYDITSGYGVVHSPNYPKEYLRNTYCMWYFSTSPGHRIQISFHDFDIENHEECIYDSLTLYDGRNENSSVLGTFCGQKQPYTIISSTNQMFMVLNTDAGLQRKGFVATHMTECGGYLHATNETKHFYSHASFGYRPYKKNVYCVWKIHADPDSSVQLDFINFSIEYETRCKYDYVKVTEDDLISEKSFHGKFCGNSKPPKIISYSNSLVVKFETDGSNSLKGFSASYEAVKAREDENENFDNEDTSDFIH